jgi:hybrid cluster-associated redox disulfide protein
MHAITADLLVDDVMRRWPATIRVFLDLKFLCVGCPVGIFHSVEDACREHRTEMEPVLEALRAAASPAAVEPEPA